MNFKNYIKIFLFLSSTLFSACTDKFEIPTTSGEANVVGDTVYVQSGEPWTGFNNPKDITIGKEPFIYVADTDNDRIVMMDETGRILGTRSIKKPVAIAQDFELDLIVCAQFDTVVQGVTRTYSAVYTLDLFSANHRIEEAPMRMLLPRPVDLNFPQREYTAVTAFYNNTFYVARKGPNNSSIFDPDNSILVFHPKKMYGKGEGDTLIGRVPNIEPVSSGLVTANQISSLSSFNRNNIDFIATLTGNNSFKSQWFHYFVSAIEERYVSQFTPQDGVAFILPNKFKNPEGSWIDEAGNIFITDTETDSIYKFNSFGDELESFGGPSVFNNPHGVAVFDRTLYVADSGNNRILRFILSTDL